MTSAEMMPSSPLERQDRSCGSGRIRGGPPRTRVNLIEPTTSRRVVTGWRISSRRTAAQQCYARSVPVAAQFLTHAAVEAMGLT